MNPLNFLTMLLLMTLELFRVFQVLETMAQIRPVQSTRCCLIIWDAITCFSSNSQILIFRPEVWYPKVLIALLLFHINFIFATV